MILTIQNTSKAKVNLNAKLGTLLPDRTYNFSVTVEDMEQLANRLASLATQGAIVWDTSENPLQDDRTEGATISQAGGGGGAALLTFATAVASTFIASVNTFIRVEPNPNLILPLSIQLPDAAESIGGRIVVKRVTGDMAPTIIVPLGTDTIDGNIVYQFQQEQGIAVEFVSDGATWHSLRYVPSVNLPTIEEVLQNKDSKNATYTYNGQDKVTLTEFSDGSYVEHSYDGTGLILESETIFYIETRSGFTTKLYTYTDDLLTGIDYA